MVKPNRPVLTSSRTPSRTNALTTTPVLSAKDWLLTLLALILLAALSILAHLAPYFSFELSLSQAVQQFASPTLDTLANAVDWLGYLPQMPLITTALGLALFVAGWRWEGVLTVVALVIEGVIDGTIKLLVRRPRPEAPGLHIYHAHADFTYPSGHVFSFIMVFGLLGYFCYLWLRSPVLRAGLLVVLIGLIILIGPVRLYLGEHWAIDVLAGYVLGSLGLFWTIYLYWWGKPRFFARRKIEP